MRKGGIGTATLIGIGIAFVGSLAWMINYTKSEIEPVSIKADEAYDQAQVANVKLDFLLGQYGAQYVPQENKVVTSTKK